MRRATGAVLAAAVVGVVLPVATPGTAPAREPDPLGYEPVRATFSGEYSKLEDSISDDGTTTYHTQATVSFETHGSRLRLGLRGQQTWRPLGKGTATVDYRETSVTAAQPGVPCSAQGYEITGSGEADLSFRLGIPGRDPRPRDSRRIHLTNRWMGVEIDAGVPATDSSWREVLAEDGSCSVERSVESGVGGVDVWLVGKAPKRGRVVRLHPQPVAEGPSYSITDSADATIRLSRNPALRW